MKLTVTESDLQAMNESKNVPTHSSILGKHVPRPQNHYTHGNIQGEYSSAHYIFSMQSMGCQEITLAKPEFDL